MSNCDCGATDCAYCYRPRPTVPAPPLDTQEAAREWEKRLKEGK